MNINHQSRHRIARLIIEIETRILLTLLPRLEKFLSWVEGRHVGSDSPRAHHIVDYVILCRDHLREDADHE